MSLLEQQASKAIIAQSGLEGTIDIAPIVANKIVTSTNMKLGAYTVAAQPISPALITVLTTAVTGADTQGTIVIVGTDKYNVAQTETITPISGTTVSTTKMFKTITSVTGVGWVINIGNDTIVVGVGVSIPDDGYYYSKIKVISAMVVASQTSQTGYSQANLVALGSIPVGEYPSRLTSIGLTSGTAMAILSRN